MNTAANVLKLPKTAPSRRERPLTRSRHFARKMARQSHAAAMVGTVAATLVGLSLSHLAHGIELVTSAPSWESWAMAVGIDLGFVSLEVSQLTASTDKLRRTIERFSKPAIWATLAGSAALNAFAFAAQAPADWRGYGAMVLGACIPAMIYALTRIGAAMYLDLHSKA